MLKEQAKLLNRLTIAVDLSLVALAFVVAYYIRGSYFSGRVADIREYSWILLPAFPVWYYLLAKYKLYKSIRQISVFDLIYRILCVSFLSGFVISALVLFFDRDFYSRFLILLFVSISCLFILLERICLKFCLGFIRRRGKNYRQLLIVGTKDRAQSFIKLVEDHKDWGLRICGVIQVDTGSLKESVGGYQVLGRLEQLSACCKKTPVDEVVFCLDKDQVVDVEEYLQILEELGITVRMVLDFYNLDRYKRDLSFFEDSLPILTFHLKSLDAQQYFLKRIMDIIGSLIGLTFLGLILPIVAVGIKIESPGPIFFSQQRIGENGRPFRIWKFRTMHVDAEKLKTKLEGHNEMNGHMFKIKNDPRLTFLGKFLRWTSIDELPQFWNVLLGNMSLVGTRPPTIDEVKNYENWHRRRISIKPGITGLWQVSGRSRVNDFDEVVKLDLQYIDNWTLGLDIRILLKTVWVVLNAKGSY